MKKILSLMILISATIAFVACDKESDPNPTAPTVALDATTAQNVPGSTVSVKATVTAPGGAKTLNLSGGVTQSVTLAGQTSAFEQTVDVAIPANAVVKSTIPVVFTVTDNANQSSAPVTLTITVGDPVVTLDGETADIAANMTLDASKVYLIKNQLAVKTGITLTIPAGTVIKGDKATKGTLIVEPGAKLIANGTAADPIIFTSSQAAGTRDKGDWGGIVILGNAYVNQNSKPNIEGISPAVPYGTINAAQTDATVGVNDENSGSLQYVRVEYAGIELTPNNETNGITFGGVGSGTTVDYVQVSYGGDDAFEWFGGTVNAKHLVSLATWDDDFDTDFGWRGNVQFAVAVRAPFSADQSGSTAFESDSQGNGNAIGTICDGTNAAGCTQGVFSNVTVLGPRDFTRSLSGNYTRAMHIRRRTAISIFNSVITGFPGGLTMDDAGTIANYTNGAGVFKNNVLVQPILPNSASNSSFATGNFYYGSNVTDAATTGPIPGFWEGSSANIIIKGTVVGTSPNFVGSFAAAPTGDQINPYTDLGLSPYPFYAASTSATYPADPSFAVTAGSLTGQTATVLFPGGSKVDKAFFDKTVTFKGAFGATDWTDGWAHFQPLNVAY